MSKKKLLPRPHIYREKGCWVVTHRGSQWMCEQACLFVYWRLLRTAKPDGRKT